jgi:predicted dehydrogenase
MKQILKEEAQKRGMKNHATTILAKFNCAYSEINRPTWWDDRKCAGPIVEQATHLVDLARYIAESEVSSGSTLAHCIGSEAPLGQLSDLPKFGEGNVQDSIPVEHRIPRVTTACWRFESGALCQLTHGVMLHGKSYEAEIEVWADGLRMRLEDPYSLCRLTVRRAKSDDSDGEKVEEFNFGDSNDDPYYNEAKAFLDAIKNKDQSLIRSSYEDAFKTYELTWDIKRASEKHSY